MDYKEKSETGTRRQPFSLSLIFHQKRNRNSCLPDPDEPTCQEKIHYPVFNPRDPRHNPEASIFPWRRQESSTSSSDSQTHRPITWVQSISRRSFHRVRSSLLALRAGVLRRSTAEGEEFAIGPDLVNPPSPVSPMRERQGHFHSSGVYSSSTQEDLGFGFEMYRMSAPPSSPISDTLLESTFRSTNENPVLGESRSLRRLSPIIGDQIRNIRDATTPYWGQNYARAHEHTVHQVSREVQQDGDITTSENYPEDNTSHALSETTSHNLTKAYSPWGVMLPTASKYVDFVDPQSVWAEQHAGDAQQPITFNSLPKCGREISPTSNYEPSSKKDQQQETETRSSSVSPEMAHKSQEPHDMTETVDDGISESSTDALFAFPGIYREMLEQWEREGQDETPQVPQVNEQTPCTIPHDAPYVDPPSYQDSGELYAFDEPINHMNHGDCPETQCINPDLLDANENQPLSSPSSSESEKSNEALMNEEPCSKVPVAHVPISEGRYLSDPLLSLLSHGEQPQSQIDLRDYGTFSLYRPASVHEEYTSLVYPGGDAFGFLPGGHENPLYTPEATTSPEFTSTEMTSRTSASTGLWSPIDSDILVTSPITDQNEYFLADGKTSRQYPDRGNQPITLEDGNKDSEITDAGASQMPEGLIVGPEMVSLQFIPGGIPSGIMDFEDEFTDDEFYPGTCVAPRQFS